MKTKILTFISLLTFAFCLDSGFISAQNQENFIQTSVTQDFASNMRGGLRPGEAHLGLINLDFTLNTQNLNLWKNGTFRIHIQNTYGETPTENLVGDIQVFSNIENGTSTYLYQFWYQHTIGDFSMLVGKHDLNELFFASDYAGEYINSSFGIMPVASLNVPVSIFPLTTLGFVTGYEINNSLSLRAGLYNGRPGEITSSNFGTNLNLQKGNGLFYVGEFHVKDILGNLPGTLKLGMFHHSGEFETLENSGRMQKGASGLYFIADQAVFLENGSESQGLGTMIQAGYSPDKSSINDFYLAYGLNYTGLFSGRDSDMIGLAMAHASANTLFGKYNPDVNKSCETAIELSYKYNLSKGLIIQPDFQYIIHPGMRTGNNNAFVGMLRIQWSYN
jgi:porin